MRYRALTLIFLLAACDKPAVQESTPTPSTQPAEAQLVHGNPFLADGKTAAQNTGIPIPPEAPSDAEPTYIKVSKDVVELAIGTVEVNRAGETLISGLRLLEVTPLEHESFKGPLGPSKDAIVFFDKRPESEVNLMGWVIGKADDEVKAWRFFWQTGGIYEIKDVFFEDIYKDGHPDILVTYSYMTGMGPDGAVPQTVTVAFTYEKGIDQFVAHDDLFEGGKMPETAADTRTALRAKGLIK